MRAVRTIPQTTPVTTTTTDEEGEDRSRPDFLEPVTALESVTPVIEGVEIRGNRSYSDCAIL